MTERLNTDKRIVGAKQVRRALDANMVDMVYIADDADKKVIDEIEMFCRNKQIQVIHVETMEKLGKACKIDISAATAALLK